MCVTFSIISNMNKLQNSKHCSTNMDATSSGFQFLYETDTNKIIPILEKRLPKSSNIYNMCRVYNNFKKPEEMGFYIMHSTKDANIQYSNLEESVWVLATYYREDYGMRYAISAPPNPVITSEIKEAFVKCPFIDWNKSYHFACIDFEISPMIWEISTKIIGNSVTSMPCKVFAISREAAVNLDVTVPENINSNELHLQPMDKVNGTEFICSTWKYAIPKTSLAITKLLDKNKSVGLYDRTSGKVICGMCINDCGLMGMLHTLAEYRGKGYATLVAKQLMKNFAQDNEAAPCSAVEIKNFKSIAFHEKLGMTESHFADFIKYVQQEW